MFRHLPDLHLGARTAPSGQACAPAPALLLELGAPTGTVPLGTTAPTVSVRAVTPALANLHCVIGGCSFDRYSHHTGFCEAHHMKYLDRVGERTQSIGRGDLP